MNPNERGYFESRLTDLLLGELTAEEAAELRQAIGQDAELAAAYERLKQTVELVHESAADPEKKITPQPAPLKLSDDRRQKLLAHFKTVELKKPAPKRRWTKVTLLEVAAVLAIIGVLAAMLLPVLEPAKERSFRAGLATRDVLEERHRRFQEPITLSRPAKNEQTIVSTGSIDDQTQPATARTPVFLPDKQQYSVVLSADAGKKDDTINFGTSGPVGTWKLDTGAEKFSTAITRNDTAGLRYLTREPSQKTGVDEFGNGSSLSEIQLANNGNKTLSETEGFGPAGIGGYSLLKDSPSGNVSPSFSFSDSDSRGTLSSAPKKFESDTKTLANATGATVLDGDALPRLQTGTVDAEVKLKEAEATDAGKKEPAKNVPAQIAQTDRIKAAAPALLPADSQSVDPDTALAKQPALAPIPQPEIQTRANAFSTFSLNVSDVSFKLAAASLEKGVLPEAASIRTEEFINAFDYRDPEPAAGASIAFVSERARYPFAHNRDLLRFSVKTAAAGRQPGRPLNLVLLLDNSGSMERADRVRIIQQALRVLASQLQPQDTLSVVTFARTPRLWIDGLSGDKAGEVAEGVSGLTPQGGTNLEEAMNLAYATALRHYLANGINRVVLLTDGAANLGNVDPAALKQKVEAHRKQGVALDCFGIGWEGYNDDLLEVLSRNGDGRYGFINSPEEAATDFAGQLAGALKVAASDVKVQVEFNPKRVVSYRQIGYAKHQLTKEQFRDNTVDAAEIAAAESGNALYTVETNPAGEGPVCTVRVRYKIPGTTDYREQEWTVPFTGNAVSLDQAGPAMRLAATAGAFSEWLASSPFATEVTPDKLLNQLGNVPETYGADARPKKLEWTIRQAKSLSGK